MTDVSLSGFIAQASEAKTDFYKYGGDKAFMQDIQKYSMKDAVKGRDKRVFSMVLTQTNFADFAKDAYDSPEGYSIRVNPLTGEKEMFVAGTRDIAQWGLNFTDAIFTNLDSLNPLGSHLLNVAPLGNRLSDIGDPWRKKTTQHITEVAKANGIEIIYGHSRGGALVADMKLPGVTKVGLDSAMLITHNRDMLNLNEFGTGSFGQAFDGIIGLGGRQNVGVDYSKHHLHGVWGL